MGIHITILGSGSAGNCTLLQTGTTNILVDAGLSGRQITRRLQLIDLSLDQIDGILLTHEHRDHTRGLAVLCKSKSFPVYANRLTAEAVAAEPECNGKVRYGWHLFSTGHSFDINDLVVESFSVPHDAYDPVGYVVRKAESSVGVLTDLGHATKLAVDRVRKTDVLILEANHDVRLLQEDAARPWPTKQRIMSRHGHLNNDAAANLAGEIASHGLRHLFLAHLSRDCNRPELALRAVGERLREVGAGHITMEVVTDSYSDRFRAMDRFMSEVKPRVEGV